MSVAGRSFLWQAIPAALFVAAVSSQIFGPRPIGVADNNDFPKILGRIGIWVAPEFRSDRHNFFVTDYRIDETNIWDSQIPSSETWIARCARRIGKAVLPPGRFDMRIMGGIHMLLAALAMWLCLGAFDGWPWHFRAIFTAILLLIFSDAEYVQFFNTAYMDAASLVFLMLVFAVAWNVALNRTKATWKWGLLFGIFGALFLRTKLQHQPCLIPLSWFCFAVAWQACDRTGRLVWAVTPAVLFLTSWSMVSQTPADYRVDSAFSVVFTKLLPFSPDPASVLSELGRPAGDLAYYHMQAFSPGSPLEDPGYRAGFLKDVTTRKLLAFYARHPDIMFAIMRSDFLAFAPDIPVGNFGTMRRMDSPEPVFRAKGLRLWSDLRSSSCLRWPWLVPLLYLIASVWSVAALIFRTTVESSRILWLTLAISVTGCLSFAAGSLGDATETSRHIVLYQEATDMLCILSLLLVVRNGKSYPRPASRRNTAASSGGVGLI